MVWRAASVVHCLVPLTIQVLFNKIPRLLVIWCALYPCAIIKSLRTCCLMYSDHLVVLRQDPKRQIRLDTHVLNTEAHPFSIKA